MARIHYYVHGRGRGHASRSRAVIEGLRRRGHEVTAFAGRDAVALLREQVPTHEVDSLLPEGGNWQPRKLARRTRAAMAALRHEGAAAVVSDGDMPGLIAARLLGRPSVAVGHGLVFLCCARPSSLPAAPWRREAIKAVAATAAAHRRVAVNFVPLRVRHGRLARPAIELPPATERTPAGPLLCYFRDGASPALLRDLTTLGAPVILFAPTDPDVPGIQHEPPSRARFLEVLGQARAVVATAGSQLISECVALGVPQFAAYAPDDDEQALNVAMLRHAGLGDGAPLPQLSAATLRAFLDRPAPAPSTWDAPEVSTVVCEEVESLLEGRAR